MSTPDIATLGIKVDAEQVQNADKSLQGLAQSGQGAEKQAGLLTSAMERLARMAGAVSSAQKLADDVTRASAASTAALSLGQQQLIERFNEQAKTIGMSRSQLMAYQAAQMGVTEQTRAAVAAVKAYEDGLKAAADAKQKAADSAITLSGAIKVLAAAWAALKVADYVKDSAMLAARYETLGVVMEVVGRTAGYTKTQMEAAAEGVAKQGITMLESRNSVVKLVQAHIDLAYASKLARIAQDAAVIGGINSSEAFERLVNGVARGNVLILRNIGINVSLEAAYKQMADTLHKNVSMLTENERVQARLNAVIERGTDIAGTYESAMGTAGKQLLSMKRYTEDLKTTVGSVFNEVLTVAVMAFTDHLKDANGEVSEMAKNGQLAEWGHDLTSVFVGVANAIDNILTGAKMAGTYAAHFGAQGRIDDTYREKYVNASNAADKARVRNEWVAALNQEQQAYEQEQDKLGAQFDRFQRAADERMAARLEKQKKDAADRLAVDRQYAQNAQAIAFLNAGKSVEVQRAAQMKLMKDTYVGTPNYRDTEPVDSSAITKEASAYANLITKIRAKIDENNLELQVGEKLTESQRAQIELTEQLANKKVKLSAGHIATAEAAIKELGATEDLLKSQAAQKDVTRYIAASTAAREQSAAALDVEYQMYGKNSDARAIAMVAVDSEKWKQAELADLRKKNLPISDQVLAQLNAEAEARTLVGQATLGQTKALQYADQLRQQNQQFAIDYLPDAKAKAAAQLAIDKAMWQSRIALAGEGTEARKKLEDEYTTWLQNQQIKPQLDAQVALWNKIEQVASDTFMSIENGGANMAKRLRDTLKNILFAWLYEMTLKKWVIDVRANVIGAAGGPMTAATGGTGDLFTAAASASSNPLIAAVGSMSSLVKGIGGGLSGIGDSIASSLGSGIQGLGNSMGSSSVTTFGQGMQGFGADGSLGGMSGAGQAAGQVVGAIGNVVAGYMIGSALNSAISGKYEVGSGFMKVEKVATAVASYFGPQFGALAGVISGIANRAFGMGPTELKASGLRGTLSSDGATGQTYQQYHQDGGWFRSDKNWTDSQNLTTAMSAQLTQAFQAIKDASGNFAKTLGLGTEALDGYSKAFDIAFTKDAAENQKAIADFFAGMGDDIAHLLVPNLDQFSRTGETAATTLQRLAGEFQATTAAAQSLGKTADAMFGTVGMDSATARDRLVQLAGGTDALVAAANSFSQNYMTDAERLVPVSKALDAALGSLGLNTIPTTIEGYKALVQSIQPTDEASAKLLVSLLQLSDAFYQVHKAAEQTAATLGEKLDAAYSTLERAVASQKTALQASYEAALKPLDAALDRTKSSVQQLTSLSKTLRDAVSKAAGVDMSRAEGQARIQSALAIARAGGALPTADSLKDAIAAVSRDNSAGYSSAEDYQRDRYMTAIALSDLADVSDGQLTAADRQVAILQAAKDAVTAAYNAEVSRLDGLLATAQRQIDAVKGVDVSVQSVEQAIAGLQVLLGGNTNAGIVGAYASALGRAPDAGGMAYWQQQAAGGMSTENILRAIASSSEASGKLDALYESILGRHGDAGGMAYWQQQLGNGTSLDQIASMMRGSDESLARITSAPGSLTTSSTASTVNDVDFAKIISDTLGVPLAKIASFTQRTAVASEDHLNLVEDQTA